MDLQDLKEKLVAVLGFGVEGKATTAYLLKHGVRPTLFDQKPWNGWSEIEKLEIKKLGLNFIFGPDAFKELAGFDVGFRSPGILLSKIKDKGLKIITSQTKWFFEHCPAKIIGVTGTKGKGTTASLIYEILSASLRGSASDRSNPSQDRIASSSVKALTPRNDTGRVYLTGNIGKTPPLEILDNLAADDYVVYELSSFQVQDLNRSPHIGVVLMVTQEHLDYHKSVDEYRQSKEAIVKFQTPDDFAVINADFENSMRIGALGKGKKLYFSRRKHFLDFHGRENQESKKIADALIKNREIIIADFHLPAVDLQLRGEHNLENVSAAILAARCAGLSFEDIKKAVINFKGLEHRLEFVAKKHGIKFYNDSFSTTPETAIAAIKSFNEPLVVILGGSTKHADFTDLGRTITESKNIKAVILIGQEAGKIKSVINIGKIKTLEGAKNMGEIFNQIKSVASAGDVVLLSPACASFDMFSSYVDRGNQFKEAVNNYSKC